jgi:hypothetical protein
MVGEFFREAAVLVVVFGFLDQFLRDGEVTFGYSLAILSASGFLFMSGVVAELTREE